jgi:hypothetical protein
MNGNSQSRQLSVNDFQLPFLKWAICKNKGMMMIVSTETKSLWMKCLLRK